MRLLPFELLPSNKDAHKKKGLNKKEQSQYKGGAPFGAPPFNNYCASAIFLMKRCLMIL